MSEPPPPANEPEPTLEAPPPRGASIFYRSLRDFFRDLPSEARRFWLLVMLTGVAAGLVAAGFLHLLRLVQLLSWPKGATYLDGIKAASPLRRVVVPTLAGGLVTVAWLATRQKLSGHGTPGVIEAIWRKEGRLSLPRAFLRDAMSIIAVSMGASLGREGALIQTSAATGATLGAFARLPGSSVRVLCACGAAAGIAAAYNVPIGGAVFGLEVLLGSFDLELFGPIVIACVLSTLVARQLIENRPTYPISHYNLTTPRDFGLMLLLGPLLGVASAAYVRGLDGITEALAKVPKPFAYALPPLSLAVVGLFAVKFPELLGNGYDTVELSLLGRLSVSLLLVLPLLKFLATSLNSASGVPGGLFTPSLYVGALAGGALGELVTRLWPSPTPAGAYALVGMGCILAGTTHAPVSSVLIVFELTDDYNVILPLMVACVLAAAVSRRLSPDSIYTSSLRRRQVALPEHPRPEWLRQTKVSALVRPGADVVESTAPFEQTITRLIALEPGRDLYVVGPDGRYLGAIVLEALKGHLPDWSDLPMVVAADVMDRELEPLTPEMPLSEVAARFAKTYLGRLPVVERSTGRLLGTVSKSRMFLHGRFQ